MLFNLQAGFGRKSGSEFASKLVLLHVVTEANINPKTFPYVASVLGFLALSPYPSFSFCFWNLSLSTKCCWFIIGIQKYRKDAVKIKPSQAQSWSYEFHQICSWNEYGASIDLVKTLACDRISKQHWDIFTLISFWEQKTLDRWEIGRDNRTWRKQTWSKHKLHQHSTSFSRGQRLTEEEMWERNLAAVIFCRKRQWNKKWCLDFTVVRRVPPVPWLHSVRFVATWCPPPCHMAIHFTQKQTNAFVSNSLHLPG